MKDYEQKKKWVKLSEQDLKDKNFQEAKREQLMELFYRIYDDTSRLATQKIEFEKKMCTLVEERKELLQQQEHIQKQIKGARSELND